MGQICAKLRNPDYSRQAEENVRSPFHQLDSIKLPDYPERQLRFYRDMDDKVSILSNILLSDFMTLLNNLPPSDSGASAGTQRNIKTDKIVKDEWKKFCENKILKNPIVKKPDQDLHSFQTSFFDDLADDVIDFYQIQNQLKGDPKYEEVPKIAYFSVGFNYCYPKISQKVLIMLSLFTDSNSQISISDDLCLFIFLLFSLVFRAPLRLLAKGFVPLIEQNFAANNIRREEAEKIVKLDDPIVKEIIIKLSTNLITELFGEDQSKVYSRDEFKNLLLEEKFIWIFSNKGIKSKIEEELTRLNIEVSSNH